MTGYFTGVRECRAYHLKTKLLTNILLNIKLLVVNYRSTTVLSLTLKEEMTHCISFHHTGLNSF